LPVHSPRRRWCDSRPASHGRQRCAQASGAYLRSGFVRVRSVGAVLAGLVGALHRSCRTYDGFDTAPSRCAAVTTSWKSCAARHRAAPTRRASSQTSPLPEQPHQLADGPVPHRRSCLLCIGRSEATTRERRSRLHRFTRALLLRRHDALSRITCSLSPLSAVSTAGSGKSTTSMPPRSRARRRPSFRRFEMRYGGDAREPSSSATSEPTWVCSRRSPCGEQDQIPARAVQLGRMTLAVSNASQGSCLLATGRRDRRHRQGVRIVPGCGRTETDDGDLAGPPFSLRRSASSTANSS